MSKRSTTRRFQMERLEDRQMMAGDIRAQLVNGTIFLNAASAGAAEAVQVFQLANGMIRVEGQTAADGGKTTINGGTAAVFGTPFAPFTRLDLQVTLGGGQDAVNVHDAKLGSVKIFTGDTFGQGANDADVVRLERVRTSGAATVNTGAGADVVGVYFSTIGNPTGADDLSITAGFAGLPGESDVDGVYIQSSAVFGKTTVNTGASADYVTIQNSNFGDSETDAVVIDAGAGSDTVELGMPNRPGQITGPVQLAGSLAVLGDSFANSDAESGNDIVRMHSVFADFDVAANLRAGNDRLELTNVHGRFLTFHGEKGNDTMIMVEAEAQETLFALMGDGDDILDLTGVKAKALQADGGSGFDRLEKHVMQFIPTINQLNWEQINGVSQFVKRTTTPISSGVLTAAR